MVDENKTEAADQTENERVESIDDEADFTLGQFREKTKDLPDSTVLLISALPPSDDEESTADENTEDDEDEEDDSINAPILGIEVEDYTIAGENGGPDKTVRAISVICAVDDLLEDDEDEDEPVDTSHDPVTTKK